MSESITRNSPPEFLESVLWSCDQPLPVRKDSNRPYVTLTFAQSLDGKIAGKGGKQLILSGKESMVMTHWMRSMHDGILIGIGTALNDDPQLNTRHLPVTAHRVSPRPIILDSNLRLGLECKLLKNYRQGSAMQPWVVCSPLHAEDRDRFGRKEALEKAGAKIVEVPSHNDLISIGDLLPKLYNLGIGTLMVEGGSSIIASFLAEMSRTCDHNTHHAVDMLIITVAPTLVGDDGIGYGLGGKGVRVSLAPSPRVGSESDCTQISSLHHVHTELMGRDTVFACKLL
ncbi:bacterial bifunctional deaminase-reductase [Leucogyrophana mollusca]|uniref:Bacterial bifunctional deaminase-reductase n=1 Tax=Leucogyrophana mollusca TaxID=85980 RepID=A0ACB8BEM8_9AGAM|nr:bacterial bifunctional deaminase-reductase [Leucogyrophana mollusca]